MLNGYPPEYAKYNLRKLRTEEITYLYDKYAKELFAYGITFSIDRDIILDAIQDVFLNLSEKEIKLNNPGKVKFYLFSSLKNRIVSILRKESHFLELTDSYEFELYADVKDFVVEEEKQRYYKGLLDSLLSSLTDKQREAIYLYFIQELSYEETAVIMNITVKSARKLVYKALQKMQEKSSLLFFFLLIKICHL